MTDQEYYYYYMVPMSKQNGIEDNPLWLVLLPFALIKFFVFTKVGRYVALGLGFIFLLSQGGGYLEMKIHTDPTWAAAAYWFKLVVGLVVIGAMLYAAFVFIKYIYSLCKKAFNGLSQFKSQRRIYSRL